MAVDNFNGSNILGRSMRVDHVENHELPERLRVKDEGGGDGDFDGHTEEIDVGPGHAYKGKELANDFGINHGQDLFAPVKERSTLLPIDTRKLAKVQVAMKHI